MIQNKNILLASVLCLLFSAPAFADYRVICASNGEVIDIGTRTIRSMDDVLNYKLEAMQEREGLKISAVSIPSVSTVLHDNNKSETTVCVTVTYTQSASCSVQ